MIVGTVVPTVIVGTGVPTRVVGTAANTCFVPTIIVGMAYYRKFPQFSKKFPICKKILRDEFKS